jgi:signal transduction histidine kinase
VTGVLEELGEIARGQHPGVLSVSGLPPALRALVRRSAVPVTLDVQVKGRLPQPIEIAAYYAVAEALTNVAKYADASANEVATAQRPQRGGMGKLNLPGGPEAPLIERGLS